VIDSRSFEYATGTSKPSDLVKTGYHFDGWQPSVPTTMPASDMTVTEQWTILNYGVELSGAQHSTLSPMTVSSDGKYNYGSTVQILLSVDDGYSLSSITAK
jgi:hypothetical protein